VPDSKATRAGVSKIATLWRLSWRDRWLLLQAAVLLPAMRVGVRVAGVRRVHAALARRGRPDPGRAASPPWAAPHRVREAARLVDMAARHAPFSNTCLHRSLTLWWLLRRRGVACSLRIGVRRQHGQFDAHAWVEHDGAVVNDHDRTGHDYAPLSWRPADTNP
jgi:hypothetical protein